MKCFLGVIGRGYYLSYEGVNSELNLKMIIFVNVERNIEEIFLGL